VVYSSASSACCEASTHTTTIELWDSHNYKAHEPFASNVTGLI
jgi:hypothetical protein